MPDPVRLAVQLDDIRHGVREDANDNALARAAARAWGQSRCIPWATPWGHEVILDGIGAGDRKLTFQHSSSLRAWQEAFEAGDLVAPIVVVYDHVQMTACLASEVELEADATDFARWVA